MNGEHPARLTRREFLARGGALVVSFSLARPVLAATAEPQNIGKVPVQAPKLPGSLEKAPLLDSWIRIDASGAITVFTGKAELGQGIKTALIQVAAEELVVDPRSITLVTADTGRTANEGYTAGSQSMQDSGTIRANDGRSMTYGQLVTGETLHVNATPESPLRDPRTRGVMGKSMQRVDIPAKVTGLPIYVQDLRLSAMVHARVVRPPSYEATLASVDTAAAQKMPGVLRIVRNGSFLAVIAEHEYQAVVAMRALAKKCKREARASLPPPAELYSHFQNLPAEHYVNLGGAAEGALGAGAITATYRRPYQMHASIGPSCAVGLAQDGIVTIYSHTQGVYPLRAAIAEMLQGPTAAAVANAVADAIGVRIRELPLTRTRVKAAVGV